MVRKTKSESTPVVAPTVTVSVETVAPVAEKKQRKPKKANKEKAPKGAFSY